MLVCRGVTSPSSSQPIIVRLAPVRLGGTFMVGRIAHALRLRLLMHICDALVHLCRVIVAPCGRLVRRFGAIESFFSAPLSQVGVLFPNGLAGSQLVGSMP